jgi:predicted nucleotidyltransferase component of viral defense system
VIPQREISRITNGLAVGRRRIQEAVVARDYCLGWFLAMLGRHPLREKLAFKGGTALRRCWYREYRFSEDLDFTALQEDLTIDEILAGFQQIYEAVRDASGIQFTFDQHDRSGTASVLSVTPCRQSSAWSRVSVRLTV